MKFEREKKLLIEMPPGSVLKAARKKSVSQSYLVPEEGFDTARVRRSVDASGAAKHTFTAKRFIGGFTREEYEREIDADEYLKLKEKAVGEISKDRYMLPFASHVLEIDVFPFWRDKCILEIELDDENEEYVLPDFIRVIRDVTSDAEFTNASLAARFGKKTAVDG